MTTTTTTTTNTTTTPAADTTTIVTTTTPTTIPDIFRPFYQKWRYLKIFIAIIFINIYSLIIIFQNGEMSVSFDAIN